MKQTIVIVQHRTDPEKQFYFGPWPNADEACEWAYHNCRNLTWHWQEITTIVPEGEDE
jgi:hypothetical protein